MQLAILHYHLNRGGVTQSILNHLEALATREPADRPERVGLVYSGRREGWSDATWRDRLPFECHLVAIPKLDYDASAGAEPETLGEAIAHGLGEAGFDLDQTLIHAHNHALGKNASLPGALTLLAQRGCRVLLQVHDFAEDFRPSNYRHLIRSLRARDAEDLAARIYPQAPGIHYATLSSRDHGMLQRAGVPANRLHVLPNPIAEFRQLPPSDEARERVRGQLDLDDNARLIVYPVRGIRRKNLGEMLLHSALAGPEACYAVTLAPENPAERASFDRWQDLSEKLGLGCKFDIGVSGGVHFSDAMAGADAIVTTSVAEGFGMVFLESSLAGQPLVGRDLPEITSDFVEAGVAFPGLQPQLRVPIDWIDLDQLRAQLKELHMWACRDFNITPPPNAAERLEAIIGGDSIDFALLPALCQTDAISHAAQAPSEALQQVADCNENFDPAALFEGAGQEDVIAQNAAAVRQAYSPEAIGDRLGEILQAVMADQPSKQLDAPISGSAILQTFLQCDRLNPVRIEA